MMEKCHKCGVPLEYYEGWLGYESLQCPICHYDINDKKTKEARK